VLTADRSMSDFFEIVARLSKKPKEASNWISNELRSNLNDPELAPNSIDELPFKPHDVAELIALIDAGEISGQAGRKVLRAMFETGKAPKDLVASLGLAQVNDTAALENWCREALVGKDKIIADVKAGKTKAVGALVGPVMKASKGSANPQVVQEILIRLITGV
jgi:aspartyl-tRNA(Asn)/glutamyl-tRNA(Gln) amidotransferase subunit B